MPFSGSLCLWSNEVSKWLSKCRYTLPIDCSLPVLLHKFSGNSTEVGCSPRYPEIFTGGIGRCRMCRRKRLYVWAPEVALNSPAKVLLYASHAEAAASLNLCKESLEGSQASRNMASGSLLAQASLHQQALVKFCLSEVIDRRALVIVMKNACVQEMRVQSLSWEGLEEEMSHSSNAWKICMDEKNGGIQSSIG